MNHYKLKLQLQINSYKTAHKKYTYNNNSISKVNQHKNLKNMQAQYQTQIKQILQKLHFNSIDQLLQLQTFSIDKISSRSSLHGIIVQQYLLRLHEIALKTQLLQKKVMPSPPTAQILIQFNKIYPGINFNIQQGELLEILGRANAGKTTLMINCIKQAIQKNMQPILLSSSKFCTEQYRESLQAAGLGNKLIVFQFQSIGDLAMLIHIIGNQILSRYDPNINQNQRTQMETQPTLTSSPKNIKYILFIDCLSQIEQQDQIIEFDSSQKFRRLINTFTTRTQTSIIYSYRVNNSLFQTQYKKDHHRPKCKNSKEWDGWTNKNVMIDFMIRKRDGKHIVRVTFPKSLDNKLYEIFI